MILGIGSDICGIERIARALARFGDRFATEIATPDEQAWARCWTSPALAYALCFAAKEAGAKALGTGIGDGIALHDIRLVWSGANPRLLMTGGARQRLPEHVRSSPKREHALSFHLNAVPDAKPLGPFAGTAPAACRADGSPAVHVALARERTIVQAFVMIEGCDETGVIAVRSDAP